MNTPEKGKNHSEFMISYCADSDNKEKMRENNLEYWSHQENRDNQSKRLLQFNGDHPEAGKQHSEDLKNSDKQKLASDKKRGGNDICMHHYIYDFNDLDKYTIPVTRSEHQTIHWNLRKAGLEVPHINILKEELK